MMKIVIFVLIVLVLFTLSGCRRSFLDAPEEMQVPEGSTLATCDDNQHVYKFVYQNDGIYLYYIDDVLQNEEVMNTIQESSYLHGESVFNYINATFSLSQCDFRDYEESQ